MSSLSASATDMYVVADLEIVTVKSAIMAVLYNSSRGRVVKASDSKSDGLCPRRFESCRLRDFFFNCKERLLGRKYHMLF